MNAYVSDIVRSYDLPVLVNGSLSYDNDVQTLT